VCQVRPASANVTSEHITSVAFVMDATCQFNVFIRDGVWIAPNLNGEVADGREENLDIRTGD
jgi:hypothetical protein